MKRTLAGLAFLGALVASSQAAVFTQQLVEIFLNSQYDLGTIAATPGTRFIFGGRDLQNRYGVGLMQPIPGYPGTSTTTQLSSSSGSNHNWYADDLFVSPRWGVCYTLGADRNGTEGQVIQTNSSTGSFKGGAKFTDPAGPLRAFPDSMSDDAGKTFYCLFEVKPATGAHKIMLVTAPGGDMKITVKQTFSLPVGESVLDCAPIGSGGFVVLTGTPALAYTRVVRTNATMAGPFLVGAASQIAYSPANGGEIFTAGTSGANAFFTRGPLNAAFVDAKVAALPFTTSEFAFTCSANRSSGAVWWGGYYRTGGGDKNGFVLGTQDSATLDLFGAHTAGGESYDETVNSIALDAYGQGMWAADGQMAIFDATTGAAAEGYPSTPDPTIQYRDVSCGTNVPYGTPNSNFGVLGYNATTKHSYFVFVSRESDPLTARVSPVSPVGGTNPTLIVSLYGLASVQNIDLPITSDNPSVIPPSHISFLLGTRSSAVPIGTLPVATAQMVTITVGSGTKATAVFTLQPPTPRFFTPATQTISGGDTTTTRLTLTGKSPVGGISVDLGSDGAEVSVAPSFVVDAGLLSRSFVIHSSPVVASTTRTVTATYAGVSQSTTITLMPR